MTDAAGLFDNIKNAFRGGRDALDRVARGKNYSISSAKAPLYELFLLNKCLDTKSILARGIDFDKVMKRAREAIVQKTGDVYETDRYRDFLIAAALEVTGDLERKTNRDKVRQEKLDEEYQRQCASNKSARPITADATIADRIAKEAAAMYRHYVGSPNYNPQPRFYSEHQKTVLRDIRALFSELSTKMGSVGGCLLSYRAV